MIRSKFISAAALLIAVVCAAARAAAPALPPDSIAPTTVAVIHVEAGGISPDAMKTAAQTILGANAKVADETIGKFKEKYDKAIAAGAVSLTMVVADEKKKDDAADAGKTGSAVVYVKLKPGANIDALHALITADMKPEDKEKAVFVEKNGYLVMYEKGKAPPTKGDDALAQSFTDALGTISEASVQIAIVPNERMKADIVKNSQNEAPVKGLKDAGPIIANSKWMTIAISLGNTPGVAFSVHTADAGASKTLSDSINASLDDLKAQAANPNGGGPLAMVGPLIGPLVEGLRPNVNGSQVGVALKGPSLTMIANFAAQMGLLGGGPK